MLEISQDSDVLAAEARRQLTEKLGFPKSGYVKRKMVESCCDIALVLAPARTVESVIQLKLRSLRDLSVTCTQSNPT